MIYVSKNDSGCFVEKGWRSQEQRWEDERDCSHSPGRDDSGFDYSRDNANRNE